MKGAKAGDIEELKIHFSCQHTARLQDSDNRYEQSVLGRKIKKK
jgi:hypothetical protein